MLTTGETYRELGADFFVRRNPDARTRRLLRELEALGHHVSLAPAA
jgi:hypothetical protein